MSRERALRRIRRIRNLIYYLSIIHTTHYTQHKTPDKILSRYIRFNLYLINIGRSNRGFLTASKGWAAFFDRGAMPTKKPPGGAT